MTSTPRESIVVAGAGSIGCFVGGMLAAAGRPVTLLGRARTIAEIETHGLRLTDFGGNDRTLGAGDCTLSTDTAALASASIILVAVKSADTAGMAATIARHAPERAIIVSLQNGIGNVATLQDQLPGHAVLGGMVPFNVIALGDGRYHRATSGDIVIARDTEGTAAALSVQGLRFRDSGDIGAVQWGKLLINLNNAINALSGRPLREQLQSREWRRLMADQMAEGLAAVRAEGISPASATPVPAGWTPHLLRLPDLAFRTLLGRTMTIDPQARSSMWEDLQRGRPTEIDYLQGVITGIADRRGLQAPLSRRIVALVKQAEAAARGSPGLTPGEIRG